ncbi:TrbI/VirB10 family protein [Fastidiosibacter lacustris]|uniref:TrbI/VirB10 family protein n=1 Tax=Fastidiosibacter lacustris TaxID=2056695 RepID=UPI0013002B9D|nr:TrbI/VirB10 family protein [Fastidiosibacter lacustris]
MLKFLKNHPRIRILIIFAILVIVSITMLLKCSKNGQTYLQSQVNDKKIEVNQKNPIKDDQYQKLVDQDRQQKIKQAEHKNSSYIEDVFASSTPTEKQENQAQDYQQKQMDPVTFYDYKNNQQQVNKPSDTQSTKHSYAMSTIQENLAVDPQTVQKNFEVILKSWNKVPSMKEEFGELANGYGSKESFSAQSKMAMFKAGDILIAVIDTAVNSDQPDTPILAHIVVGPYKHAKLLGSFVREEDKLVVKFTTLSIPDRAASININAYAIDQATAQTALASDVDHHYLLRYGSLFSAAFLQGFGTYFTNAQNNSGWCYVDPMGGKHCQGSEAALTTKNAAYAGLGQIGTALSSAMTKQFDKPPTVTLNQGSAIGVLIMQDIKV